MMGLLMVAFGCGRARGRAAVQKRAAAQREAIAHIVQRQHEVAKTAGGIKHEINRLSAGDVDSRLRKKWRYPDAAGDR
ncbi:hypothetical protein [Candidatus Sodalis pierantonius]|uniref:hypothetical protein n=1 Tax=Candidatus Sodalis pierantonii TaxID=1486991 RepID=UPI0005708BA8|nr:hypothetical protein [Candidatus Sodalis pierantonius]